MLKRTLITIAVLACLAASVQAHEPWEYGYAWIGKIPDHINVPGHLKGEVPVKIQMVRWADLFFDNKNDTSLILKQQTGTYDFADCILLRICQNFSDMVIVADVKPTGTLQHEGWEVYLEYGGDTRLDPEVIPTSEWQPDSAEVISTGPHLTGNPPGAGHGYLKLCVKVHNVDMQSERFDPAASEKEVAVVRLTMYPSDTPSLDGDKYVPEPGGRISPWSFE